VLCYYSQLLDLPALLASLALGIAMLFDAICDPLVGARSDRTRSRLGRRHPHLYAAALPLAGSFVGCSRHRPASRHGRSSPGCARARSACGRR
jgi:Na+/melibiose symporter-like transporter